MNKVVIIGSLAYDHVMQYDGVFKDAIVPENYNIALSTHDRKVFYGGCGGNIAYSLRLMEENPALMTVVGRDFDEYKEWLIKIGVEVSQVYETDKFLTASAFIVTDHEGNQVTLFDPGAMHGVDTTHTIEEVGKESVSLVMIAPDKPSSMVRFARECQKLQIPYIFDPGQQLSIFPNEDLLRTLHGAHILIANEYETQLLAQKLSMSLEEIASIPDIFIETHGDRGSQVRSGKEIHFIKAIKPSTLVDPTGCGDAFRAGVIAGLQRGFPIQKACQTGALLATMSLECLGTQCHSFTLKEFSDRFENSFGEAFNSV